MTEAVQMSTCVVSFSKQVVSHGGLLFRTPQNAQAREIVWLLLPMAFSKKILSCQSYLVGKLAEY